MAKRIEDIFGEDRRAPVVDETKTGWARYGRPDFDGEQDDGEPDFPPPEQIIANGGWIIDVDGPCPDWDYPPVGDEWRLSARKRPFGSRLAACAHAAVATIQRALRLPGRPSL